jgi:hypothetical protein
MGVLEKGSVCPTVPGWKTQTLLELAAAHAEDGVKKKGDCAALPERARENLKEKEKWNVIFHKYGLDRYCVYTSQGHGREFQKPAGLVQADPDRMALIASAPDDTPLADQVRGPLADQFLNQVGSVQLASAYNPTVRIVVLDSYPTGEGVPTQFYGLGSLHGYGMAHLANKIVCGTADSCPIQIATRLALRYDGYNPDPFSPDNPGSDFGGHQGRIGDLATEIPAEILHLTNMALPHPKLILNLSIGWDGEYHEDDLVKQGKLDTWTQAVYAELKAAHDAGVLIIAAAGNRFGGEDSHGPLLPAAWEAQCPDSGCGEKIVYAVGGVDWQGLPLPNARPAGLPELVAYADHAVVDGDADSGVNTRIYTGSSVAAVVASSIAAVTWHLRLGWTPAQVMQQMADHPNPISGTPTFYPSWKSQPSLKRLSLRQTVNSLCSTTQPCPGVTLQFQGPSPADLSAITTQLNADPDESSSESFPNCNEPNTVYRSSGALPIPGCPIETLPDMSTPGMIQSQPEEIPCPPCNIAPVHAGLSQRQFASLLPPAHEVGGESDYPKPYTLAAALDPDWAAAAKYNGTTIENAILVIDCTSDSPSIKERVDVTTQFKHLYTTPSDSVRINFGPVGERTTLAGCTASVDFTLSVTIDGTTSRRSVQSPVYVDP